jgi:hypothetical protein
MALDRFVTANLPINLSASGKSITSIPHELRDDLIAITFENYFRMLRKQDESGYSQQHCYL